MESGLNKLLNRFSYNTFHRLSDKLHFNENTIILVLASIVGIIGGFGAVGFRVLIESIQNITLGGHDNILELVKNLTWYNKLLLPVCGGLIVGPVVYYFGKETKGPGIPEVMEAVALKGGVIRARVMFLKAFVSAVTIGTGGSVGREGPIVQIGSSLGSTLGQWLNLSKGRLKVLVACGAAAGIAATFNAPITGVIFAVEIILGNYAITTLVPLIMSSVLATIVGRWYFGDIPAFEIPFYSLQNVWEIGLYALLAISTGVLAIAFINILYKLQDIADNFFIKSWIKTPVILVLVGVIIVFFPQVYGVGYDTITQVLKGELDWLMLLFLIPAKFLATTLTIAAGGSGGVFAPSLFLGAIFGGFFGIGMHNLLPEIVLTPSAYAVVGMSAMVAATTHAPITAFLVIFEMTGDYKLILPLMLCAILASFVSSLIKKDSIYILKLLRKGIDISKGMEISIMKNTKVLEVMNNEEAHFYEHTDFNSILEKVIQSNDAIYYVITDDGKYQGSFNLHDIKELLNEDSLMGLVIAQDLIAVNVNPTVNSQATLAECMKQFNLYEVSELPVVDDTTNMKYLGKISRTEILSVYNREILLQDSPGLKFVHNKTSQPQSFQNVVDLPQGYSINTFVVKDNIIGKSIKQLEIRKKYNITIIAINRVNSKKNKRGYYSPAT